MRRHGSKIRWLRVAHALLTAFVLGFLPLSLHAAGEEDRVLMLYGVDPYLPPFLVMDRAVRETVVSQSGRRVLFFSESLDTQRVNLETIESELVSLFAKEYGALRINVVVAVSRTALDFFLRHGERLWPGARVVYLGFVGYEDVATKLPAGATAVVSILDAAGTIDIARRLQPLARRLVVISGTSEIDRTAERQAREALAKVGDRLSVEYLSGVPQAELVARVADEGPDSIIIYLVQFRDRDGRPYEPHDVLRAVVESSRAPVYGAAETYIGLGAVAGSAASYEARGRLVGEQVLQALAGRFPEPSRTVLAAPNRCIADARALRRWSLNERELPGDCQVLFKDVSVWRRYGWQIALTLAIVAAQAALIVGLLSQRRKRRLAEEAEQAQRAALGRAARLTTAGELTGAIAHEINQPLGAILTNVDTAELMLDSGRDRREELRSILDDIRRDDLRASEVIKRMRDLLGKQNLERKVFDLNDVVRELESIMRAEARRRSVALEIKRAPEAIAIMGDRIQMQQVLINLVLNAMDAVADQPEARRMVSVTVAQSESGAVLTVRDRGQGIAPEHQARLFESFFSTKPSGMGLGLSISRSIVEAHGGRVSADSDPVEGTVFRAELPLAAATGAS